MNTACASTQLQKSLSEFQSKSKLPAFGVAVIKKDSTEVAASGVRSIESQTPVNQADLWHIGSLTKSMTATLVAILVEEKKLSWTSTLRDVFPSLKVHADYQDLPITRFLTHSAGILDEKYFATEVEYKKIFNAKLSNSEIRKSVLTTVLSQPGTFRKDPFPYSNLGYMVVGAIIEQVTGLTWEQALQNRLFQPLQMHSCGFGPTTLDPSLPAKQPWGHRRDEAGKIVGIVPGPEADNHPAIGPAGTVHCSLQDIAIYAQFHLDHLAGRPNLLGLKSSQRIYQDIHQMSYSPGGFVLEPKSQWALGQLIWHNGSNTLNYCILLLAPKLDRAIFATTNFGNLEEASEEINKLVKIIRD